MICYDNTMNVKMEESWKRVLHEEFAKDYFLDLSNKVREAYRTSTVFPEPKNIFNAFMHCSFFDVKVVILGQDPYHGVGQAHGLAFSVKDGVKIPPSLRNIYKEIHDDLSADIPPSGNLVRWADQGVLLLNATLTVEEGAAGAHQKWGWETFTDAVIQKISDEKEHVVFLLWGKYAQDKGKNIDSAKHLILTAPHPSPLSAYAGFFGCRHFSKTNTYLMSHNQKPIDW